MKKVVFFLLACLMLAPAAAMSADSKEGWPCFGSKEDPEKYCVSKNPDDFFEAMNKFFAHGIKFGATREAVEKKLADDYIFSKDVIIAGEYKKYTLTSKNEDGKSYDCKLIYMTTYLDHVVTVNCINSEVFLNKNKTQELIDATRTNFENMYGLKHETACEQGRVKCEDPDTVAFYIWPSEDTAHYVNTVVIIYRYQDILITEDKYILDGPGMAANKATSDAN